MPWSTGNIRRRGARRACSRPRSRRSCGWRWQVQLPTGRNAGGHAMWLTGWPSAWAARSPRSAAGTTCSASNTASRRRGRATPWPIRNSKTASKKVRPLLQAVATAFPHAQVELWATDEHRIGLKPLLRRIWAPIGQRPIAIVQQRLDWRSLVGFAPEGPSRLRPHRLSSGHDRQYSGV